MLLNALPSLFGYFPWTTSLATSDEASERHVFYRWRLAGLQSRKSKLSLKVHIQCCLMIKQLIYLIWTFEKLGLLCSMLFNTFRYDYHEIKASALTSLSSHSSLGLTHKYLTRCDFIGCLFYSTDTFFAFLFFLNSKVFYSSYTTAMCPVFFNHILLW